MRVIPYAGLLGTVSTVKAEVVIELVEICKDCSSR